MHPNVQKFIKNYETEAKRKGYIRKQVGENELIFLEQVWGPMFNYNFEGLELEYPFFDAKGGQRFVDFLYKNGLIKLSDEIDGFTTHARNISHKEFDDHLERQNDLLETGWHLVRFSAYRVKHYSLHCQERIKKAIGYCWTKSYGEIRNPKDELWELRLKTALELARWNSGSITATLLAREINVSAKTASNWLRRFVEEGYFEEIKSTKKIIGYKIKNRDS